MYVKLARDFNNIIRKYLPYIMHTYVENNYCNTCALFIEIIVIQLWLPENKSMFFNEQYEKKKNSSTLSFRFSFAYIACAEFF